MQEKTFCPFLQGDCKPICVFYSKTKVSLGDGNVCKCKFANFISLNMNVEDSIVTGLSQLIEK